MSAWRLNCSYECQWNGALHCGHLFLVTIKMIRHCKWYMCWQVPKIYAPCDLNGEQQIRHSLYYFFGKGWGVGHKIFLVFFDTMMTYSQLSLGCVAQFTLTFSNIFSKLSRNILDILGHDVKPCDWNLPSSWHSACILMISTSNCVAWDVARIHARSMWFKFHLVAFRNVLASF